MNRAKTLLATTATLLALTGVARAADPELVVFDWAGWEIEGVLTEYVARTRLTPSSRMMTRRSRKSLPASNPM